MAQTGFPQFLLVRTGQCVKPGSGAAGQRGRGTFLYVIWRLVAVLLFLPVISTLIVPVIGQMVAIFHVLGIPADMAVLGVRVLAAGVIACFVSMLLSVIFVRAFVISLK
ncbi:hypothetical protein [uncultured Thalassospira sp.]|uniref:hypothetical protein n=1 Tax=uncultured Thalassospira sp. TaxID=404382 RepID=UPI00258B39BE|nr:hypothetical protein [uncultured Thalassospira sp.]